MSWMAAVSVDSWRSQQYAPELEKEGSMTMPGVGVIFLETGSG